LFAVNAGKFVVTSV